MRETRTSQKTVVKGVSVEIRVRAWKRWTTPRYEIFLDSGRYSSGMVWREGRQWASTEGPVFTSRRAAIASLIDLCLRPRSNRPANAQRGPSNSAGTSKLLATCPVCAVAVRRHRLALHMQKVHGAADAAQVARALGVEVTSIHQLIEEAPASRSSERNEPAAQRPPQLAPVLTRRPTRATETPPPPPSQSLVKCPRCQAMVKRSRLPRHIKKVHGAKGKESRRRANARAVSQSSGSTTSTLPAYRDHRWNPRFVQGGLPASSRRH